MLQIKCHFCKGDDCFNEKIGLNENNFCLSTTGKCFTSIDLKAKLYQHERGCVDNDIFCLSPKKQINNYLNNYQNNNQNETHYHFTNNIDAYIRCCMKNFCNNEEFIEFPKIDKYNFDYDNDEDDNYYDNYINNNNEIINYNILAYFILSLIIILIIIAIIFNIIKTKIGYKYFNLLKKLNDININNDNNDQKQQQNSLNNEMKTTTFIDITNNNNNNDNDKSYSSGSGLGALVLSQRTVAKEITLIQCVGKGRYGEVWKGLFRYEYVAVKKFLSRDEASFNREIEIYTNLNKNDYILTFIGSDVISENSCTRLWLITDYHEYGSLFDFLSQNVLTFDDMFSIMLSIATGLTYLHTENIGTEKKVAIAHRDIKSKNILMKTKNICCIADFGLAVTKQTTGILDIGHKNYRVGTKRYMAPEVLDDTFVKDNFTAYRCADIYSFSLVLWEILRRINIQPILNYEVPYQFMVPSDPSFDDMRKIVCIDKYRPNIPKHLEMNEQMPELQQICKIIRESWSKNPSSRLTVLRIKKSLRNIMSKKKVESIE